MWEVRRTANDDGFDFEDVNGIGEGGRRGRVTRVEALRNVSLRAREHRTKSVPVDEVWNFPRRADKAGMFHARAQRWTQEQRR